MTILEDVNYGEYNKEGEFVPSLVYLDGDDERALTVKEFRDFLNKLIEEGLGDHSLKYDGDGGNDIPVYNSVHCFRNQEEVIII